MRGQVHRLTARNSFFGQGKERMICEHWPVKGPSKCFIKFIVNSVKNAQQIDKAIQMLLT